MEAVFLKVLNMSLSASAVIVVILALRALLRRAPKKWSYALWSVAAFRLCCPWSFQAAFSLFSLQSARRVAGSASLPATELEYIPPDIGMMAEPRVNLVTPELSEAVSAALPAATPQASANPLQVWIFIGAAVWCAGMAALLLYSVVSYARLRRRMDGAVLIEGNVYETDRVRAPFILGLIRPRIYLPLGLEGEALDYVLAHERYHIRRRDYLVKAFAFALLTLHWFNPLVWLAFHLMGKDMEMSCDEQVLGTRKNIRKAYSSTLLSFATGERFPTASPLAFGETGVKTRIKNALRWKKPQAWVTAAAAAVCLAAVAACAANPKATGATASGISPEPRAAWTALEELPEGYALEDAKRDGCVVHEDGTVTAGQEMWSEFLAAADEQRPAFVRIAKNYTLGDPSHYDPAYYEEIKDDFPRLYLFDLDYDGERYTVRWFDGDGEHVERYPYLIRCAGKAESPTARYRGYVRYLLTNDDGVTWDDVWRGMISSRIDDDIRHFEAYTELLDYVPEQLSAADSEQLRALLSAAAPAELSLSVYDSYGNQLGTCRGNSALLAEDYFAGFLAYRWAGSEPLDATETGTAPYIELAARHWRLRSYWPVVQYKVCLATDDGTQWFTLLPPEEGSYEQHPYSLLQSWYQDAQAAEFHRGSGTPLTADELLAWQEELESIKDGALNLASCFFTSYYADVRNLNLEEFLAYCPLAEPVEDESEFAAVNAKARMVPEGGTLSDMPVPTHRYRVSRINETLTQYAGVTLNDLRTDWRNDARMVYVPAYDAFYNFTSDSAEGVFRPVYGERDDDVVTLWSYSSTLTLRYRPGGGYHITSFLPQTEPQTDLLIN